MLVLQKRTTECDKSTVTYDVCTAECDNKLPKMRKKIKEPPNVIKSTIICDVGTAQYKDEIVKCKKKKENHQM